jgi:hypothetical protein
MVFATFFIEGYRVLSHLKKGACVNVCHFFKKTGVPHDSLTAFYWLKTGFFKKRQKYQKKA